MSFIKDSMIYTHEIAFPSEVKKAVLKVSFFSFILLTQIVRKSSKKTTATKGHLILITSNLVALIPSRSIRQMLAIFSRFEFK